MQASRLLLHHVCGEETLLFGISWKQALLEFLEISHLTSSYVVGVLLAAIATSGVVVSFYFLLPTATPPTRG
jgi:hypothetical protein